MADRRVYRVKLSREKVLERLWSSGRSDPNSVPYEITIRGNRFTLVSGDLAPSMEGAVLEEEGGSAIDVRLSLHLPQTLTVAALGSVIAQGAVAVLIDSLSPHTPLHIREEETLVALGMVGIAAGLLWAAWRPRRQRSPAFWAFLDRLFADVKIGEEQL